MKNIIIIFCFLFYPKIVVTQVHSCCGTPQEDLNFLAQKLLHERQSLTNQVTLRTNHQWVPIQFHIITDSDYTNRADVMEIYDLVCELNLVFMDYDLQFFMADDYNFIPSTLANINQSDTSIQDLLVSQKDSNAINIFVVKTLSELTSLGKYDAFIDGIILKRSEANNGGVLLTAHLFGHFFNLLPTYHGWENENYDSNIHGIPAPEISPSGIPTEKMDGSNCLDAGDFVCDTKPNYISLWNLFNCEINYSIYDPDSVLLDSDVDNFMSGTLDCNPIFTFDQETIIYTNLATRDLAVDISPDILPFPNPPILQFPVNGETSSAYNIVGFDWEDVPSATSYIVEIDRTPDFSLNPKIKFVAGVSYVEFENIFEPDEVYYWRVKPLKKGNLCGEFSTNHFKTGLVLNTNQVDESLKFDIFPNPSKGDPFLNINIENHEGFNSTIKFYNSTGQLIREENIYPNLETTNFKLDVKGLDAGIYIISIETNIGFLNKKIVIN